MPQTAMAEAAVKAHSADRLAEWEVAEEAVAVAEEAAEEWAASAAAETAAATATALLSAPQGEIFSIASISPRP